MFHHYIFLLNPSSHQDKIENTGHHEGEQAETCGVVVQNKFNEVEGLPTEVTCNTEQIVEESIFLTDVIEESIPVNEEPHGKINFIWKVESSKASISNEALENAFNIEICCQNVEHIDVGHNDTYVMNNGGLCNLLIEKKLNHIFHSVHGGNIDHDLRCLLMLAWVKHVNIISPQSHKTHVGDHN